MHPLSPSIHLPLAGFAPPSQVFPEICMLPARAAMLGLNHVLKLERSRHAEKARP